MPKVGVDDCEDGAELPTTAVVQALESGTSEISAKEASEAGRTPEYETDAVEAAVVGNANSGGQKRIRSNKMKQKEILAGAYAASNTADLCNAYRAPEEKKSVEVKRSGGLSGHDAKDSGVAQDKSLPKVNCEDTAEQPMPANVVVQA